VASRKEAPSAATSDFQVGSWHVQPTRNLISNGATIRHLEPQVMDLLVFLARTGGCVASKDEIINAVWDGRLIAESTLTRSIADLRRALGDIQQSPQYIETIAKRGYRLVASVAAAGLSVVPEAREAGGPTETREAGRLEPARVVLPFTRSARDPDQAHRDGLMASPRVADRLASARRWRFVGRQTEIEIFRGALLADEPPFVTLHVLGPGGVGKTTLLEEFARVAHDASRALVRIDGRNIEPSVTGFLVALRHALGVEGFDVSAILERWPAGGVLLVDTYERLAPLDDWLRHTLLPQLPARSLVVIAGRHEPGTAWRTGVDWAALTRIHSLGNLAPDDSRTYLTRCEVPVEHHDEALSFTRGHPLALSLVADVLTRSARFASSRLDTEPDVVRLLLEKFVQDVPSRDHRLALHACVTVWATTEPLLAAALDRSDAHDLFEWLGHLAFIEHGPYGLFPHDLARDVVWLDFRWRDPDAAYRVIERVLGYLYERLERTSGFDRQRVWFDLLYVQRYNPGIRPFLDWASFGTAYAETAGARDHAAIVGMVERHEGPASAAIASHWLERQPEAFFVVRGVSGDLIGFVANLHLEAATPEDLAADPAAALAIAYAERHGPRRADEQVLYGRFWMDAQRHQGLTRVFPLVAATCSQSWTTIPKLAWCFIAMANPDLVEPLFTEIHIWRAREADFEIDGRRYGVFAHDWRIEPAGEWLRLKAERASRIDGAAGV
jgi:DNA-binding winged helix-turn-helix (wHTH) protein